MSVHDRGGVVPDRNVESGVRADTHAEGDGVTPEDAEEFTQSLGQIVAGSWRQIAWAQNQGIPEALGLSTRDWVDQRLGGYVSLNLPQRREAVAELTEQGMNNYAIADVLGTSESSVRRDKASSDASDDEQQPAEAVTEADKASDDARRTEALPDDLIERVRSGATSLTEAEGVAAERTKRIAKYVREVRDALDLLTRMVGHPIPGDLSEALTEEEQTALGMVLDALQKEGTNGRRRRHASV